MALEGWDGEPRAVLGRIFIEEPKRGHLVQGLLCAEHHTRHQLPKGLALFPGVMELGGEAGGVQWGEKGLSLGDRHALPFPLTAAFRHPPVNSIPEPCPSEGTSPVD